LGRIAEFIPTNCSIHWNQFALFSRFLLFLPFSPLFSQMLIFKVSQKMPKNEQSVNFIRYRKSREKGVVNEVNSRYKS